MKIPILCCLSLSLITVYADRPNNGLNIPELKLPSFGLNLPSASPIVPQTSGQRPFGIPRKLLPFMPVPVVKKVTHHHIHHVIAHKGVVKSKFSNEAKNGFDLDNKDNDNKNTNQLNYKSFKEDFGLNGDLNDNGFKSAFLKQVYRPQLAGERGGVSTQPQNLGDLLAASSGQSRRNIGGGLGAISGFNGALGGISQNSGGMGNIRGLSGDLGGISGFSGGIGQGGIRGYIGGQRAEFVPLIIGIIDDSGDLISGFDSSKEFSQRKGFISSEGNRLEPFIPSKETIKLFEELAKMGYK